MNQTRRKRPQGPSRKRNPPQQGQNMLIPHPPAINPQVTHHQRMRFTVNATAQPVGGKITFQNLLDTIAIGNGAGTTGFDLFDEVKVNFVELWSAPAQGTAGAVSLQYSGAVAGAIGDGRVYTDSSMGVEPAHIRARPARLSQAAQWQPSSASLAFAVGAVAGAVAGNLPVGTVVDVDLSFRTVATSAVVATQNTFAVGAAGEMYYRGLDGLSIASTAFTPQATVTG
jgi:hypothetical protein